MYPLLWLGFLCLVFIMLALDLGVFHRKDTIISMGEALAWTAFWITLALGFNTLIYFMYTHHWLGIGTGPDTMLSGGQASLQFFTGYVIEKSLSLDNIFVIAMIFSYFRTPLKYQHRVLFWGILGAIAMRGLMIGIGTALINTFNWVTYIFGAMLLMTAVKMLIWRHDNLEPNRNPVLKLAKRFFPITSDLDGPRFFTKENKDNTRRWAMTPLFLTLIMVESMDLLFAVDSIPAIFAVTTDPFLIFTSNVFAILGLRSLYFALAALMEKFHFIKISLAFLLAFVGTKMLLSHAYPIPTSVSLAVIGGILGVGILASIVGTRLDTARLASPLPHELATLATFTLKTFRRIIILVIGTTVLLLGIVMIVLPGPAFVVIPIGLAILATEFIWARILLKKIKAKIKSSANSLFGNNQKAPEEKKN